MKKKLSLVLVLALVLTFFTACGDKKKEEPKKELVLADVFQSILQAQTEDPDELRFFEESDPDMINGIYPGLTEINLKQQAIYFPPITGHACEVVLVEVADSADVEKVQQIFQTRIDSGQYGCDTESAELWKNKAQVQTEGNYVGMIVLPEGYTIPDNVFQ